jgi:hypothetical protein
MQSSDVLPAMARAEDCTFNNRAALNGAVEMYGEIFPPVAILVKFAGASASLENNDAAPRFRSPTRSDRAG